MKKALAFVLAILLAATCTASVIAEEEGTPDPVTSGESTTGTEDPGPGGEPGSGEPEEGAPPETAPAEGEAIPPVEAENETAPPKPASLEEAVKGMDKVADGGDVALYLGRGTGTLRLVSKKTLEYFDTKVLDGKTGNDITQNAQKSDVVFTYISDLKSGALKSVDTYSMSVEKEGMEIETIENGIRIRYHIGDSSLTEENFPESVPKEKFQSKVLDKLDYDQKEEMEGLYRLLNDRYVRTKSNRTQRTWKNLYHLMFEVGEYTLEDLEEDNAANGTVLKNQLVDIQFSMDYVLDGNDLIVRLPMSELIFNERLPIQSISLLPYFASATRWDEGYMFVPDGSGALIQLNSSKLSANSYNGSMYGVDYLRTYDQYLAPSFPSTLPVYGLKKGDAALMAIVEKGAAIAELSAEIAGKSDEFNHMGLSFNVRPIQRVLSTDSASTVNVAKWPQNMYTGDIQVRYKLLADSEADYSGMARSYRAYLLENGGLKQQEAKENAPLFLEVMGAIDMRDLFLGISYDSTGSLTTFQQTQGILEDMVSQGMDNLQVEYTGWMKNGVQHPSLTKLSLASCLGSKKDFKSLQAFAEQNQIGFYPKADIAVVSTNKGFNITQNAARGLSGDYVQDYNKLFESHQANFNNIERYYVSPNYMDEYTKKAAAQLSKWGVTGISSGDLGSKLVPDYNKKREMSREDAMEESRKAMANLSENQKLMLSNPGAYGYAYASAISDLPFLSNREKVFDASVPFVQMVLNGSVPYSSTALNLQTSADPAKLLLQCMETGSSPKYVLTNDPASRLVNTDYTYLFSAQYALQKEAIEKMYQEFNGEYYQAVKGASMDRHEILSNGLRKCTYSNGTIVLVNYGKTAQSSDGARVEPMSYQVLTK